MTEREAFEAWYYSDADHDLADGAPSIDDVDAHHKYWMLAAWQASRKAALEDAAVALEKSDVSKLLATPDILRMAASFYLSTASFLRSLK